jgi:hypothetical protein
LQDSAHPLESSLPRLFALIRLRGDAHHPTGIAEKPLRTLGRYDWWVRAGQQEEEVDRAAFLQ